MNQASIIFELYNKMAKQNIISAYHGEFTQEVVDMLLKQAKWDLSNWKVDRRTLKKTYGILVECLENILKHTSIYDKELQEMKQIEGIVVLSNDDMNYKISVGNLVSKEDADMLKEKIDMVNGLNKTELKVLHTEVLSDGNISIKGGAGLGIIEIAMKSGNKLNYEFTKYNDKMYFFALQTVISSKTQ